ncbi:MULTISPECIES: hypothetical protein [Aquimarina]|uniref:hypothetical protein n=1 Tax=Aquimarina TaxID=290174 RepID=UPI0004173AC5|nr:MULTISPECIES: hypothetical protein [Aquimarina]
MNVFEFLWCNMSAEQLLLEVFRAPTTRNYFVANKIGEVLDLIAISELEDDSSIITQKLKS